jgi:hypothetical protein
MLLLPPLQPASTANMIVLQKNPDLRDLIVSTLFSLFLPRDSVLHGQT